MRADPLVRRGLLAALIALPLALHAGPAADPFTGEWEFQGDKPDPTTGNEEYLRIRLKLQDDGVVCGIFLSGWQGGRRIVEGLLRGKVRGNRIENVTYDAGWANVSGHGTGRIRLRNGKLEWQVTRPFSTDYMIRKAVLERAEAILQEPPPCR